MWCIPAARISLAALGRQVAKGCCQHLGFYWPSFLKKIKTIFWSLDTPPPLPGLSEKKSPMEGNNRKGPPDRNCPEKQEERQAPLALLLLPSCSLPLSPHSLPPSLHELIAGLFLSLFLSLPFFASITQLTPFPMPRINVILYFKKFL